MGVAIIDKCIERRDGSVLCYDAMAEKYYLTITKEISEEDVTKEELAQLMKAHRKVIKY